MMIQGHEPMMPSLNIYQCGLQKSDIVKGQDLTSSGSSQIEAQSSLQLPRAVGTVPVTIEKAFTKGRFKCVIRTQDIADDIFLPRAFRHGNGSNLKLDWLECVLRDNPERGLGNSVQLVNYRAVSVEVIDLETGQIIKSRDQLIAALLN